MPPPFASTITSKRSAISTTCSGNRAGIRPASVGKYSSNGRPFTVILPEPGRRKTRATLDLRRPVPRYCSIFLIAKIHYLPELCLLGGLIAAGLDGESHRLLRRVRVLIARINLGLAVHLLAQLRLRQHPGNRFFHHAGRTRGAHTGCVRFHETAWIAGEMTIDLLRILFAGQPDLGGIHNNDVIARINKRRPRGFVLAHQQSGGLGGKFAQYDVIRVDHMPVSFNSLFGGEYGTHEHTTPIKCETRKSFSKKYSRSQGADE